MSRIILLMIIPIKMMGDIINDFGVLHLQDELECPWFCQWPLKTSDLLTPGVAPPIMRFGSCSYAKYDLSSTWSVSFWKVTGYFNVEYVPNFLFHYICSMLPEIEVLRICFGGLLTARSGTEQYSAQQTWWKLTHRLKWNLSAPLAWQRHNAVDMYMYVHVESRGNSN